MAVTFNNTLFAVGHFWGISLSGNVATTNRAGQADVWLNGTVAATGDTFTLTNLNGTFSFTVYVPAIAQEFKVDDRCFTLAPTWTCPNRPRDGQVQQQGCIVFEWDPAKMKAPGGNKAHGGEAQGGACGNKRARNKVLLQVKLLSRLQVRVFVNKSAQVGLVSVSVSCVTLSCTHLSPRDEYAGGLKPRRTRAS